MDLPSKEKPDRYPLKVRFSDSETVDKFSLRCRMSSILGKKTERQEKSEIDVTTQ